MLDEVIKRLRDIPFRPFAILTSDGRRYPIPHPDHAAISPSGNRVVVFDDDDTSASLTALHVVAVKDIRRSRPKARSYTGRQKFLRMFGGPGSVRA